MVVMVLGSQLNILGLSQDHKNLLSVHQFTKATKTYFEFHPHHFFVKHSAIGKLLLRGQNNDGLYTILFFSSVNKSPHPTALVGERAPVSRWHSHLGHLAFSVVRRVLSSFKLPVLHNMKGPSSCPVCLGSKSHQLPFSDHFIVAKFL
jgi:hypothetical protein